MSIKKISKKNFAELVGKLIATENVIGVQSRGDKFEFAPLSCAEDLRLDYDVTLGSPKKYFQPAAETLLTFEGEGKYKSQIDSEKFILIGVHPYDMVALNQMDTIFSKDNYDKHYMARRNNATIIACDITTPAQSSFASSVGTATVKKGYDILLTDIGDSYVADAATEKGQTLLAKTASAIGANDADLKKRQAVWDKNEKQVGKNQLKCKLSDLPKLLEKAYDHPVWEEKAKTCFSCGSCNLVCPTCYCFGIIDDVNWDMTSGQRQRVWDGCLLDGFTKVAGDHEFRSKRANRFRHRLYRKGKYVPAMLGGQLACVGCGRCTTACLPDIANPVNIYNRLAEDISID